MPLPLLRLTKGSPAEASEGFENMLRSLVRWLSFWKCGAEGRMTGAAFGRCGAECLLVDMNAALYGLFTCGRAGQAAREGPRVGAWGTGSCAWAGQQVSWGRAARGVAWAQGAQACARDSSS